MQNNCYFYSNQRIAPSKPKTTPDGRKVKSTITMDGNVMKQVQVADKTTYIERAIEGDMMNTVSCSCTLFSRHIFFHYI